MRRNWYIIMLVIFVFVLSACGKNKQAIKTDNDVTAKDYKYEQNEKGTVITQYIGSEKDVTIPTEINGQPVVEISKYAFQQCDTMESVVIPEKVQKIDDLSFCNCTNLKSVKILSKDAILSNSSFSICEKITDFENNSNIKNVLFIGDSLFSYGLITSHYPDICVKKGKRVNVWQEMQSSTFSSIWSGQSSITLKNELRMADIVIFLDSREEAIARENQKTVKEMIAICNKNTRNFMFSSIGDSTENVMNIPKNELLQKISDSNLFESLKDETYNLGKVKRIDKLVDRTPDSLSGFFIAMLIYDFTMEDTCSDLQGYDYLSQKADVLQSMQGRFWSNEEIEVKEGTQQELNEKISKVETIIDDIYKQTVSK